MVQIYFWQRGSRISFSVTGVSHHLTLDGNGIPLPYHHWQNMPARWPELTARQVTTSEVWIQALLRISISNSALKQPQYLCIVSKRGIDRLPDSGISMERWRFAESEVVGCIPTPFRSFWRPISRNKACGHDVDVHLSTVRSNSKAWANNAMSYSETYISMGSGTPFHSPSPRSFFQSHHDGLHSRHPNRWHFRGQLSTVIPSWTTRTPD